MIFLAHIHLKNFEIFKIYKMHYMNKIYIKYVHTKLKVKHIIVTLLI